MGADGEARRGAIDLAQFLYERGEFYQKDMSSPVEGELGCSRISPHLVWGSMSMREMYQATTRRQAELRAAPAGERGFWLKSLNSFVGRLHWHCHFSQKLEDQPDLESRGMIPAYDAGIHRPQVQMQSGVTGINTVRVYSPVKQGLDQDPTGDFTRTWVPELAHIPGKAVHDLSTIEAMAARYPTPIVDHKEATAFAKAQIFRLRKDPKLKAEAQRTMDDHGSRKRQPARRKRAS